MAHSLLRICLRNLRHAPIGIDMSLRGHQGLEGGTYEVDAILAMEGSLPRELISVRNTLGVQVIENIQVKDNS